MGPERRRTARYPFVASAEVVHEKSGIKIQTQVSDLTVYGCYMDMINPLPKGTSVIVKIFTDTDFFEAYGTVVYSHPNLGIGVTFRDVNPFYSTMLKKWLLAAMQAKRHVEEADTLGVKESWNTTIGDATLTYSTEGVVGRGFNHNCEIKRSDQTTRLPAIQTTDRLTRDEVEKRFAPTVLKHTLLK
ncbi:MAG TPA: PilZ domain-containing protein [Candidatus Dormibacteraeota bacterium]|nr:PilZ domain-containing protein [Candidatus Dormibacteraeota bacterium]